MFVYGQKISNIFILTNFKIFKKIRPHLGGKIYSIIKEIELFVVTNKFTLYVPVNFLSVGPWGPQTFIWPNIILGVSGRVVRLTFSGDWVKQIALPSVGGPLPINWRPEWKHSWVRRSSCLPAFKLDISLFPPKVSEWNICSSWGSSLKVFRLEFTQSALLVLRRLGFGLELHISFSESPAC